jgi:hypothetical protein
LLELIKKTDPFHQQSLVESQVSIKINPEIGPLNVPSKLLVLNKNKKFSSFVTIMLILILTGSGLFFYDFFYSRNADIQPGSISAAASFNTPSEISRTGFLETACKIIPAPEYFSLKGVIGGEKPAAIIQNKKTGQNSTIEEGDNLMGYTLNKIEKGRVAFTKGKEKFILEL